MNLLILIILIGITSSFKQCNFTQFDFFSKYTLGKQDQLNRTFTKLNQVIGILPDITYSDNITKIYKINQASSLFYYIDSKQSAQVIGDNLIYVKDGVAQVKISFVWSVNSKSGLGQIKCITDPISFGKQAYNNKGFLSFFLSDYTAISFHNNQCNISRVDPVIQQPDLTIFKMLINRRDDVSLRQNLQKAIFKNYSQILNNSLVDQRQPLSQDFQYVWQDKSSEKAPFTINYTVLPTGFRLQRSGLSLNFVTQITDDADWQCGPSVPSSPKDSKIYGGIQQYLSLNIFENSARWAIRRGQFNTKLNQNNWQSRVFQFYAGDLYQLVPYIATKHRASQPLNGQCNASASNFALKATQQSVQAHVPYDCKLYIQQQVVLDFSVQATFTLDVQPDQNSLRVKVKKVDKFVYFRDVGQYIVHDLQVANLFVTRGLQRMEGLKVFGDNWRLYSRDYPKLSFQSGVMFIWDDSARN